MIDLKKLREQAEDPRRDTEMFSIETSRLLELLNQLEAAKHDSERLDWLEAITKINSVGSRTCGMETDREALFTIMPAWYQEKQRHESLRSSIDAAMTNT